MIPDHYFSFALRIKELKRRPQILQKIAVIILVLIFEFPILSQINNEKFKTLSSQDGLSQNTVKCIYQDHEGFIWLGTDNGLNYYDGENFKTFEYNGNDKKTISNNSISCLIEDRDGYLWIGTSNGLNRYDRKTNTFKRYLHDPRNKKTISHNNIFALFVDHEGTLWIAGYLGLHKYDKGTDSFILFQIVEGTEKNWQYNTIHAILEDRERNIWVGTTKGISLFNRASGNFSNFSFNNNLSPTPDNHYTRTIIETSDKKILIGIEGEGLKEFDKKSRLFHNHLKIIPSNLNLKYILSLHEDFHKNLWIGTQDEGLVKYIPSSNTFEQFTVDELNPFSIKGNSIRSLFEDDSKTLWIGTHTGGVSRLDLLGKKFFHYRHNPVSKIAINRNHITSIYEDGKDIIWTGSAQGLDCWNRKTNQVKFYPYNFPDSLSSANVTMAITKDKSGNLWVGLQGNGLKRFNPTSKKFTSFLPTESMEVIYIDFEGDLWVGTFSGLFKFDFKKEKFNKILFHKTMENLHVSDIFQEKKGVYWIATRGQGLFNINFDKKVSVNYKCVRRPDEAITNNDIVDSNPDKTGKIWLALNFGGVKIFDSNSLKYKPIKDSLLFAGLKIKRILEDNKGNIWLSTIGKGIWKYNPGTSNMVNYDESDGLQGNDFGTGYCKGKFGDFYFGGLNGLNVFNPDSISIRIVFFITLIHQKSLLPILKSLI
jgi:ligand-binding sensor domain-containing protein